MKQKNLIFTGRKPVLLEEDGKTSFIEVLRAETIRDRGLVITFEMLKDYAQNFLDKVYGTELQVNLNHFRGDEAAGWIKNLFVSGSSLMAEVEWTEMGIEKITKKLFKFVSSELAFEYPHADTGKLVSNVFIGCALTNTPAMKNQTPLKLSEADKLINFLNMFKKYLAELKQREAITKADAQFARAMLEELPAEEQEEVKTEVEEVEAKAEATEEPKEEEKPEEEKPEEALSEKDKTVSLKEYRALEQKVMLRDMQDLATKELLLKEGNDIGLNDKDLGSAVNFMLTLNDSQRKDFVAIMGNVKHVDFSTIGSSKIVNAMPTTDDEKDDARVALAEKLMSEKSLTIEEAQKEAFATIK